MVALYRAIVVLLLSTRVKDFIAYVKAVVLAMTGNPNFQTPSPPLATVTSAVAVLDAAEAAAHTRAKGAVQARDAQVKVVRALLEHLKAYVQQISDAAAPALSEAIIQSAGMSVKKRAVHAPSSFTVKQGEISGTVHLLAPSAGRRASYQWGMSTDGKAWTGLPATFQVTTLVSDLTPGTTYSFRYRPLTKSGEGNWSQTVVLLVK